jgi:hypothetical protein
LPTSFGTSPRLEHSSSSTSATDTKEIFMGYWGYGILQSDDALDWKYNLGEALDIDRSQIEDEVEDANPGKEWSEIAPEAEAIMDARFRDLIDQRFADVEKAIASISEGDAMDEAKAYQVLATWVMDSGSKLDARHHARILDRIEASPERTDQNYGPAVENLIKAWKGYDCTAGVAVPYAEPGLFETLLSSEARPSGTLLNVPGPGR